MGRDEEELLEVGGSSGRGWRITGWALILVAVLVLGVLRVSAASRHGRATPVPTPSEAVTVVPARPSVRPWPVTVGACGAETLLPVVSSTRPAERTGIRLLVGGERVRRVDFDSGLVSASTDEVVRPGEYAAVLSGDPVAAYATTLSCGETINYAMVRISVDHRLRVVRSLSPTESLLTDGNRVWVVSLAADIADPYAAITPVSGGRRVQLPAGFYPSAIVGDTLVGVQQPDPSAPPSWLALVDVRTGRVRAKLEQHVDFLAAGAGQVFWTSGCDEDATFCTVRRQSLAGGDVTAFTVPGPVCCGVVSPDGTAVAFLLRRTTANSHRGGDQLPTEDIAVLRIGTGRLDLVPGVELPAKSQPGLAFTTRDGWLVMALDAGTRTRLLAWRAGLRQPYETSAVPGVVHDPPTVVVTSH
ncbi:MAG: hypothetical protein HOV67_30130 [Kribbellaceae bacterium]|nr:hypothetical protein [Kribbellaceae bacterium]